LALGRGCSPIFIALEVEYKPLDQTDLRYDGDALEARGRFPPWQVERPRGGVDWPHLVGSRALPRHGVLWCRLEHSWVVAMKLSHDLF
jgi:hypothetical protein